VSRLMRFGVVMVVVLIMVFNSSAMVSADDHPVITGPDTVDEWLRETYPLNPQREFRGVPGTDCYPGGALFIIEDGVLEVTEGIYKNLAGEVYRSTFYKRVNGAQATDPHGNTFVLDAVATSIIDLSQNRIVSEVQVSIVGSGLTFTETYSVFVHDIPITPQLRQDLRSDWTFERTLGMNLRFGAHQFGAGPLQVYGPGSRYSCHYDPKDQRPADGKGD
jgi:hypothetical protein